MMKRIVPVMAILAFVSFSSVAFAAPKADAASPMAKAHAHRHLTPEQRETVHKIFAAHKDKLHELRMGIWAKKTELKALVAAVKAEKSDIQGLIGEMTTLRNDKYEERKAILAEIEAAGIKGFHFRHHRFHHDNQKFEHGWS